MTGIDPEDALVSTEGDEVIIDITDGALARLALYREVVSRGHDGELVIDLRDDVPRVVRRRHRSADAPRRRGWRARFRLRRTARSVPATRRLST